MGYLFGEYEIKENMVNYHKVINAAIATLATCAMLLPVAGSANADEPSNTAALGAGYTATKISHPNAGLGENDGIVNVLNGESTDDLTQGEAERGQNYSVVFGRLWRLDVRGHLLFRNGFHAEIHG